MILVFAFFLRLSSPFFIGFSLDMVLFVVSLHIGKFLWLLFRILPPRKKLNNRRLDNMKPRVCRSGLCVINSTPKVGKTFQTAKYPLKTFKTATDTKLSDLSSMGACPHSPTIRLNTQTLCTFGKKTYIRSTQRQPAERYGRVAKNKLPGRIDGVPTSLAALFFPYRTNTVKRFPSSTGLSCVSVHKPISLPQGQQDQTQTKSTISSIILLF